MDIVFLFALDSKPSQFEKSWHRHSLATQEGKGELSPDQAPSHPPGCRSLGKLAGRAQLEEALQLFEENEEAGVRQTSCLETKG